MKPLKITPKITKRDGASLDRYMSEVNGEEMITPQEEVMLSERIKQGDTQALNKIVRANLRFVISIAKQYQNQGIALQDLISEGNIGLIKAAQRFDATKGFKFISYAVWWIRQSILQAIAEQARVVRIPSNKISNIAKVNKMISKMEQEMEREIDWHELANHCDMSVEEVHEALTFAYRSSSLDAPVSNADDSSALIDFISNEELTPDKLLEHDSLKMDLKRLIRTLEPRDAEILSDVYGLNHPYPLSLDEIAKKFNLSRERVRQIKDKALMRLRHHPDNKILKMYIA